MRDELENWPANRTAEQMILGVIILDNGTAPQAFADLSPDDFDFAPHRYIFHAMRSLDRKGRGIDPLTLADELRLADKLDETGGPAFIASLFDGVPRFSDIRAYVKLVKDASTLRHALRLSAWIRAEAQAFDVNAEEFVQRLMGKVNELEQAKTVNDLVTSEQAANRTMVELEERWQQKGVLPGLSTGFPDLDKHILGLRPKYYVLAAGTSIGKTTLALNFGNNIVTNDAEAVGLIITLEMSVEELGVKTLSTNTRIDSYDIETGNLSDDQKDEIRKASQVIARLPIEYVEGFSPVTAQSIANRVEMVKRKKGRLDFVIVDYLQLLDSDGKHENENIKLTDISRTLKRISLKHKIPVIALSQLSRDHMKRADHDYILSDLRSSGSIEQDADVVLFLMPEDWTDATDPRRRLKIAKQRGGKRDVTVNLVFFGNQSRFESAARDYEYNAKPYEPQDYSFPARPKQNNAKRMTREEKLAWAAEYEEGVMP